jgi:hypothetical protein
MDEFQLKVLFYKCDDKYFLGKKCKEKKLLMEISEDVSDEDIGVSHEVSLPPINDITPPSNPLEF